MADTQWQRLKRLASGGVADLFLARSPEGRSVVVKTLRKDAGVEASTLSLEYDLLSRLRHPSLVSVLGFSAESREILGEESGPCYWMETVEGRPLLEAARAAERNEIFRWFREALEGLAYLHRQGIVHGDLSPSNLLIDSLIDSGGRLKIIDFGSALGPFGGERENTPVSLAYAAPERAAGSLTPASDLFSLGTLFYEALAGLHPRSGAKRLIELAGLRPRPLLEAAPGLRTEYAFETRVIDRMIQADRGERLGSADEAIEALRGRRLTLKIAKAAPFYSARMIGAEAHFRRVDAALKGKKSSPFAVFAIHGGVGVGKSRFLREVKFACAREGIGVAEVDPSRLQEGKIPSVAVLSGLEGWEAEDLALLLRLPAEGIFLFLEWNDDRISLEKRTFLEGFIRKPEERTSF